jgi:serine/threonine-protein kinase HipA
MVMVMVVLMVVVVAMKSRTRHLLVGTPQGRAGDLLKESRFAFNYSAHEKPCEISLTMPIRAESYASGELPPIFEMNRPEGYLLAKIEEAFAKHGGLDEMDLLAIVGGQQIGRLSYTEPHAPAPAARKTMGLREILSRQPTSDFFDFLVATYFESGVSGVQPKVLLPNSERPGGAIERATVVLSDLIVKAGDAAYPHLTQNEFLCMSAARRAGIAVPNFWLSEEGGLFVVERFDLSGDHPLGFEDMTVLMNKPSRDKYVGSYENVAKAVRLYCQGADPVGNLQRLFDYLAFMVMVRNGDGHLKNFGLLYEHPAEPTSIRLAPLYDVVTTSLYGTSNVRLGITKYDRTLALKLAKTRNYPDRKTLFRFAAIACEVKHPERVIERIAEAMTATLTEHRDLVDPRFFTLMKAEWDAGRQSLEPDRVFT